uniref:ZMYM2-like/QRICH1 C-terminal domain-containing protein n=1 Tax=Pavo cristatus TaxID=9049 RepID=A0A8C9LAL0_PAVCR
MFESFTDEGCSNVSSLCRDLSNLVTWAHSHGTICIHIPALETVQNVGQPSRDNSVLWICGAGHAYHWTCEDLHFGSKGRNEAAEKRKRQTSFGAPSRGAALGEKRIRIASSFERARRDSAATGTSARSSQQKDTTCIVCNEPPASQNQRNSKATQPAEQHLSMSIGEIRTELREVKVERSEDLYVISDDEQYVVNAGHQEERINQSILAQSPPEDVTAEVGLQMYCGQKTEINQQAVTSTAGFTPTATPAPTLCCILKSPGRDRKILESSFLSLGPLNPTEFTGGNSRARDSAGSATPKEDLESIPISNAEAKAQLEPPAPVMFFELEATVDVQQQIHLSSSECSVSGALDLNGNAPEGPAEDSRLSGPEQAPHPPAPLSPESRTANQPPESSKTNVLSKRNRNAAKIKAFREWLDVHCPSEAREIHRLPPKDLDNYLALFYTSAKKQNGRDFSTGSLQFFQNSIDRYLKDHSYGYSVVKGSEFRASQEALRQKHQLLSQREREEKWSLLENLTDENMDHLRKKGLLSQTNPQGFLHLMFVNIIRGFGASTHNQGQDLYWGQLVLRRDVAGLEYLEWKHDLNAEGAAGESLPHLFARPNNPDNCPVQDYKKYAEKRPGDMLHDSDPLYLSPRHTYSVWDQVWYSRKSLTKARMGKMLKVILRQVKASEKKLRK